MADEHVIARYRNWYRNLLRFYSRPHRERFGESMEQTFNDLCRERAGAGKGLFGFVLWTFAETSAGIIRENVRFNMDAKQKYSPDCTRDRAYLVGPLVGRSALEHARFVFMGTLLFGTGLTYELVAKRAGTIAYRAAVGIACVTGLLLVWVNAAVGIIGDEDLANAMYLGVLVVGFVGACIARFQARGMSRALFATAVAQALVPVIAMTWVPESDFAPGVWPVMGLNAVFVALWVVSGLLFRWAEEPGSKIRGDERGRGRREGVAG